MDKNEYTALLEFVESSKPDAEKFYNKGNQAAGTRLRKHMQNIKNSAQGVRLEVQDTKNS